MENEYALRMALEESITPELSSTPIYSDALEVHDRPILVPEDDQQNNSPPVIVLNNGLDEVKLGEALQDINNFNDVESGASNFNDVQPSASIFSDVQPSASIFSDVQPSASIFNDVQPSASTFNDVQPSASTFNDVQPSATIFNDVQPSASIFNDVEPGALDFNNVDPNIGGATKNTTIAIRPSNDAELAISEEPELEALSTDDEGAVDAMILFEEVSPISEGGTGTSGDDLIESRDRSVDRETAMVSSVAVDFDQIIYNQYSNNDETHTENDSNQEEKTPNKKNFKTKKVMKYLSDNTNVNEQHLKTSDSRVEKAEVTPARNNQASLQVINETGEQTADPTAGLGSGSRPSTSGRKSYRRFYSECERQGHDYPLILPTADTFTFNKESGRTVIGIIGSSDLGIALAEMFKRAGYHILILSRRPLETSGRVMARGVGIAAYGVTVECPEEDQPCDGVIEVCGYEAGLPRTTLVFVAVASRHYQTLPVALLMGKILVDVSNREHNYKRSWCSNAEYLQQMIPSSVVVKSLNTLPAYNLKITTRLNSRPNPTCGDEAWAVSVVVSLLHSASIPATRWGDLTAAREIEGIPLKFFSDWTTAAPITITVLTLFILLLLFRNQLCAIMLSDGDAAKLFSDFLLTNTWQTCGWSLLTVLTLIYLPGVLAAYMQLSLGTKYRVFPGWLDRWLRARKQLGLSALLLMAMHAVLVLLYLTGAGGGGDDDWRPPTVKALGALGGVAIILQGVGTLPSVAEGFSWSESQFVLSRLGWAAYLLAATHVTIKEWDELFVNNFKCYVLPAPSQMVLPWVAFTFILKLLLLIPCVDTSLTLIRRGYNTKPSQSSS